MDDRRIYYLATFNLLFIRNVKGTKVIGIKYQISICK